MKRVNPTNDQKTDIYTYLSRRSLIKLFGWSALGMGLWISACDHSGADSAPTADAEKGSKMESATSNSITKTEIPAIDPAAPAKTSTATFALG